jgi:valyl-tRNA synthetase
MPKKRISLYVPASVMALIESGRGLVETLAGLETVAALDPARTESPDGSIGLTFEGQQLFVGGLAEAVDAEAQLARLTRLRDDKEKAVAQFRGRLANESYVSKAPAHLVEETRTQLAAAEADLAAAVRAMEHLKKE